MCYVHLYTTYILILYIHLLLYIDRTFLLFLVVLYSYNFQVHILHLFVFFLLDMLLQNTLLILFSSFCLVSYYIFLISALHDTSLVLFFYILLFLILPIILQFLYLCYWLCIVLLVYFLPLYAHLDDAQVYVIYLLDFLTSHHIFLSNDILFFYFLQSFQLHQSHRI